VLKAGSVMPNMSWSVMATLFWRGTRASAGRAATAEARQATAAMNFMMGKRLAGECVNRKSKIKVEEPLVRSWLAQGRRGVLAFNIPWVEGDMPASRLPLASSPFHRQICMMTEPRGLVSAGHV
jgi:hypothetical protein